MYRIIYSGSLDGSKCYGGGIKQRRGIEVCGGWDRKRLAILDLWLKKCLAKKMSFEKRPEGVEGKNNVEIWGERQSS